MFYRLCFLEVQRLIKNRQALWLHMILQGIAWVIYIFLYQFPTKHHSSPFGYIILVNFLTMWFLPIFIVNDIYLSDKRSRDRLWLDLPIAPVIWLGTRIGAWLFLQIPAIMTWIFWLIVGSYWFFLDAGIVTGGLIELLITSLWSIILSLAVSILVGKKWLALIIIYTIQFMFLSGSIFTLLFLERFPLVSQIVEFFSHGYRVYNLRLGIFSLADIIFWFILLFLVFIFTLYLLHKIKNYIFYINKYNIIVSLIAFSGLLVLIFFPVELDMTARQIYQPSLAMHKEQRFIKAPLVVDRFITKPLSYLGEERWLMRRLWHYQRLNSYISVQQSYVTRERAKELGLSALTELRGTEQFAGLMLQYRDLATQEASVRDIRALDESLVLAMRRLTRQPLKRITIIRDNDQNLEDFFLLNKILTKEFTVEWITKENIDLLLELESDGYIILGGNDLSAHVLDFLEYERTRGKGLWINTMRVRISSSKEYPPKRLNFSYLHKYLLTKGVEIGDNLLLDSDGYMIAMDNNVGIVNYPLWLSGRRAKPISLLSQALIGVAPLMTVSMTVYNNDWQPLVLSSTLAREQTGNVELNVFQVWDKQLRDQGHQYWLAAEYKREAGEGALVLFSSTTWLSDMMEDAYTYKNVDKIKSVARYIVGDELLLKSQLRFNILYERKHPFAVHEMIVRYLWVVLSSFMFFIAGILLLKVMEKSLRRR